MHRHGVAQIKLGAVEMTFAPKPQSLAPVSSLAELPEVASRRHEEELYAGGGLVPFDLRKMAR
tara:strand:+ start:2543 stop:2731 length:189 start_codon:yes stop_codon:yes gene_type:complete